MSSWSVNQLFSSFTPLISVVIISIIFVFWLCFARCKRRFKGTSVVTPEGRRRQGGGGEVNLQQQQQPPQQQPPQQPQLPPIQGQQEIQPAEDPAYHDGSHEQLPLPPDTELPVGPRTVNAKSMDEVCAELMDELKGIDAPEYSAMTGKLNAESADLYAGKKAAFDDTSASGQQSPVSWGISKDMNCADEKVARRRRFPNVYAM
ncbi:hypothetical protein PIB30_009719 [Stylosanthes scabra]|uniref:Uncharacterized protein n=1 Tax=Stylosanthes scabra TaxID=79078 RepID=A0ABU6W712_9FABA|nr:hypothetical protein [Stylosanthes scabra]